MKARASAAIVSAVSMWHGLASAAEQTQHQHEPAPIEHSKHRSAPVTAQPSTQADHSQHQHQQPPQKTDEHEGHSVLSGDEPTESERSHIPPDAPQLVLGDMSNQRMIELMQMEDDAAVGMLLLDELEWRRIDDEDAQAWELQSWYGDDYNKLWFKTEGERIDGEAAGRMEALWDRIISSWWSAQAGVRHDFSSGPSRTWASFGVQGLAPYFFEVDAAVYVGEGGRTAARFAAEYDLLITQRLVLQPALEFELVGQDDPRNHIGSGLSNVEIGLRLRYEIFREFAPYVGIHWERKFGRTSEFARADGQDESETAAIIGMRVWF